jgi:predicted nucleic acid-binding protein
VILIDTAPLVALCDPSDRLHARASRDLDRFARQPLVLCTPVLTEACFHLASRAQRQRLGRFLVEFSVTRYPEELDPTLWHDVLDWLARYAEHAPDFADGYLAVVSAVERRFKVWTYDREFQTIWRRSDGSRIPLAVT